MKKKFFCNISIIFHYMTSNNLVKQALGWIVVFHFYMVSHNPINWLLVRYCIHSLYDIQ